MVAPCWLFLYDMYYDARNDEHQVKNFNVMRAYFPNAEEVWKEIDN